MSESVVVEGPRRPFTAGIEVPGDKSLSHRALILAAMAEGTSTVAEGCHRPRRAVNAPGDPAVWC